jgi:hypothetical protein
MTHSGVFPNTGTAEPPALMHPKVLRKPAVSCRVLLARVEHLRAPA